MNQSKCLCCNDSVIKLLDLGPQPLANDLKKIESESFILENLGVAYCNNCGHLQLTDFVNPDVLFKNYLYVSGTSSTLRDYFSWMAALIAREFQPNSLLDVASNDGSFLKACGDANIQSVGVDPAENLVDFANREGFTTYQGFFPSDMPNDSKYDFITAMNVCAHTPNPFNFLLGVKEYLTENGMAWIQTSQADMVKKGEFDTIYHEHYSFFSPKSMSALCERVGLKLRKVYTSNIHGGSFVFLISHVDSMTLIPDLLNENFIVSEVDLNVRPSQSDFIDFAEYSKVTINSFKNNIKKYKGSIPMVWVGIAAKSVTFINSTGCKFDMYLDEAPLKIGNLLPGHSQRIQGFEAIEKLDDCLIFIGAWNFKDEIMKKLELYRAEKNDVVILPFE